MYIERMIKVADKNCVGYWAKCITYQLLLILNKNNF